MEPLVKPIRHVYNWRNITIGNNLDALCHAYKTKSYFICDGDFACHTYDQLAENIKILPRLDLNKGKNKLEAINDIAFYLSYQGLNPFGRRVDSVTIKSDEKELSVTFDAHKNIKIKYDKLRIFSVNNVRGIPFSYEKEVHGYHVCDDFEVRGFKRHKPQVILDEEHHLVRKVYLGKRKGKRKYDAYFTYALCDSIIEDLNDVETSSNIVRLKAIQMIRGSGIGIGKNGHNLDFNERIANEIATIKYIHKDDIGIGGGWKTSNF
jgi:hypothetical protein